MAGKRKSAIEVAESRNKPHIDHMLRLAYGAINAELERLYMKASSGDPLNVQETSQLVKLSASLVNMAKEERAQEVHADYSKVDDASLLKLVSEAKKVLGAGDEK